MCWMVLANDSMPICRRGKLHGIRERVALVQEMMQEAAPEGQSRGKEGVLLCHVVFAAGR